VSLDLDKDHGSRIREVLSKQKIVGDDGRPRSLAEQHELDAMFARTFASIDGERVLAYLRAITLENVQGPLATDCAVRHLEGQRYLYAIIDRAARRGRGVS
jgi:hypothetical protein